MMNIKHIKKELGSNQLKDATINKIEKNITTAPNLFNPPEADR